MKRALSFGNREPVFLGGSGDGFLRPQMRRSINAATILFGRAGIGGNK